MNGSDSTRPRILGLLPRGEAIRNFAYSGALEELATGSDLTLASVIPSEEVRTLLETKFGPVLELEDHPQPWRAGIWHELLDLAHGRWLWSEAAQERWRLRDLEARTHTARMRRAVKRGIARVAARPRGLTTLERLHAAASIRWDVSDSDRAAIARLDPTLVFNGSQVHGRPGHRLLMAARERGIPIASFLFSWDNLTSQGRIVPSADAYIVWNDAIRAQLIALYPSVDPKRVIVTGTPQFDFHFHDDVRWTRSEYCARMGLDPDRPIVLYSTGMPNHMPGEERLVEGISDALAEVPGHPQLVVRLYAKDQTGRFDELRRRRPDIVIPAVAWAQRWLTPLPEDTAVWTNMLLHADVGINVASTVSLELAMFDKPVLNVAFNPAGVPESELSYARYYRFDHYAPVVASGAVELVHRADEVAERVTHALAAPSERASERHDLLRDMFGDTLDGRSARRVATALQTLAATAA